jgi:mutator protein MutT
MSKQVDVVIGIVVRDGKVLICQRRLHHDALGGLWEFPGGKVEPGESYERCLERELLEEVDIQVRVIEAMECIEFEYPSARVQLRPFLCEYRSGNARPLASQQIAWVLPAELNNYAFPAANDGLIRKLTQQLG